VNATAPASGFELVRQLGGVEAHVISLSVSSDGKRLLSIGRDKSARLWNAETGEEVQQMIAPPDSIGLGMFSPDGDLLSIKGRTYQVWDVATSQLKWESPDRYARQATFTGDGKLVLATADQTGKFCILNSSTGELIKEFAAGPLAAQCAFLEVSQDNRHVVGSSGTTGFLGVWDLSSGELAQRIDCGLVRPRGVLLPTGELILAWNPQEIGLWDAMSGQLARELDCSNMHVVAACVSPDGQFVFGALDKSYDGEMRQWHAATGHIVQQHSVKDEEFSSVVCSPDGRNLYAAGSTGLLANRRYWIRHWRLPPVNTAGLTPLPKLVQQPHDDGVRAVQSPGYLSVQTPPETDLFDLNSDFSLEAWVQLGERRQEWESVASDDLWPGMTRKPKPLRTAGWALQLLHAYPDPGHFCWEFSVAGESSDWIRVRSEPLPYGHAVPWHWRHVAVTRHGSKLLLFGEGRLIGSTELAESLVPSLDAATLLQRSHDDARAFSGRIRAFHVTARGFRRALRFQRAGLSFGRPDWQGARRRAVVGLGRPWRHRNAGR
jgi:WD40 repeat protein